MTEAQTKSLIDHKSVNDRQFLNSRMKKFLSYYRPHIGLLIADVVCAFIVSGIKVVLQLCAWYITKNVLVGSNPDALH